MSAHDDSTPYRQLGRFLRLRREELGKSASEFWRENQENLGIVYGRFAAIERGESIPETDLLCRIARALGLNERVTLLQWAACQMADAAHRDYFNELSAREQQSAGLAGDSGGPSYTIHSNSIPPSEFDNTWVLGPKDHATLQAHIELLDFLVLLETSWPEVQSPHALGFDTSAEWDGFCTQFLARWIEEGRLTLSEEGIQLALPHFHLPKTELWLDVRQTIVNRFVSAALPQLTPEALKAKRVFRTFTTRILSASQVESLIEYLPRVEQAFFNTPVDAQVPADERRSYSLLILLAERQLKPRK